jgi:hypothetical protein
MKRKWLVDFTSTLLCIFSGLILSSVFFAKGHDFDSYLAIWLAVASFRFMVLSKTDE